MKTTVRLSLMAAAILMATLLTSCMKEERENVVYYEYVNATGRDITLDVYILFQNSMIIAQENHTIPEGESFVQYVDTDGGESSPGIQMHTADAITLTFDDGLAISYYRVNNTGVAPSVFDLENFTSMSGKNIYRFTHDHYLLAQTLGE